MLTLFAALMLSNPSYAQEDTTPTVRPLPGPALPRPPAPIDDEEEEAEEPPSVSAPAKQPGTGLGTENFNKNPCVPRSEPFLLDFLDADVEAVVRFMANASCDNYIIDTELSGKITIISHKEVSLPSAMIAFDSALEAAGYTRVPIGQHYKIVQTSKASQNPITVYEGDTVPYTSTYVTQIFQLDNVSVSDISSVAKDLLGGNAKIIAYAPTNTLIVTDSAVNIRRMWKVVSQLDVAAPKAKLTIIEIQYADATEVKQIIEEVYGSAETSSSSPSDNNSSSRRPTTTSRRNRRTPEATPTEASANNVGSQGKYIQKIVADERTNSLIILANDEALKVVMELIAQVDKDVDPSRRAQIHVVYLEHAKAEDVAQVLSNLSQQQNTNSRTNSRTNTRTAPNNRNNRNAPTPDDDGVGATPSAVALLDDGVRITADENTNSLVIVASPEAFEILQDVIAKLDIRRKQVFVEVVILEVASQDDFSIGAGVHGPIPGEAVSGLASVALGQNSTGLAGISSDLLTGLAMGVFGESIETTLPDGSTTTIPAFGVVLSAVQTNNQVEILSTPNILTLDNEEAKIVVGRNIPFPISQGRDSNNNPIVSYQREDVAITLKVTPQINESDYVTLEIFQEVTEIEEDSSGLDVTSAGFITSKRTAETTVLVKNNQTIVIGGLMGQTTSQGETKVPVLGDLPLVGVLFRNKTETQRKTNLLIFLTPHVINEPEDLEYIYRVKVAQREEFLRRFYGKPALEQAAELDKLLAYSMNIIDEPSMYRTKMTDEEGNVTTVNYPTEEPPTEGGVGAETPDDPSTEIPTRPEEEAPFNADETYPERDE